MLPHFDFVRILDVVCLDYLKILIRITVEALADLGQVVARLYRIGLVVLTELDVVLQVSKVGIDCLDRIPDAILACLRNSRRSQEKLVAI